MNRLDHLLSHVAPVVVSTEKTTAPPAKFPSCTSDYFGLDDLLTEEERKIRYKVREFMEKEIAPVVVPYYEKAEFPKEFLVSKLKQLKLIGGDIKGYGCPGINHMSFAMINFEMARVDPSTSTFFTVHTGLAMSSIDICGNEDQKQRYLVPMAKLEKIGCFGLTEPNRGSDATNLETTAKKVDGGWILNGRKRWIGNGTFADVIIIWAKNLETGNLSGFIVDKGSKGFSASKIENKISLRIVQNADMVLENVFVPDRNKLAHGDDFANGVGKVLEKSRIYVAWKPVGAAMGIFDNCLAYAKSRKQFGVPIASYQLIQERLTRMLGTIQSMILVAWRVSRLFEAGKLTGGQSSLAKAINTLRGREVAALGREILGGNGIVQDYHVARLFLDMESFYTYEGTYDINSLVAGREVTGISAIRASKPSKKK